ncbi:MAG TPA: pseudouridine synthase, partial [bacterium]|nr:pseudouridine synthase [bacterium]
MDDNPAVAAIPSIIYEDEELLVLDKPAGMPSVSLKEGEEGTLAAWILARYPAQSSVGNGVREAGLVHRLDNDTSGLVVAAKSDAAFERLRAAFKGELVEKR